jgi:hypothetical protein
MDNNFPEQSAPVNPPIQPPTEPKQSVLKNKWLLIGSGLMMLLIFTSGAYFLGKNSSDKSINAEVSNQPTTQPTIDPNPTSNPSPISAGTKTYKNNELGIEFSYPSKYGDVKIEETYGTEEKKGRGLFINFENICNSCKPGDTPFTIDMASPGLVEMGAVSTTFGGIGTSRPHPLQINTSNTNSKVFQGANITGLIYQADDNWHKKYETRVVFEIKSSEFKYFTFLTHDELGQKSNADNLISIAKSFRLLK